MAVDAVKTSAELLGITSYEDKKATTGRGKEALGKQDFLTLFTAQLQNQNPLDPVKNEAFVAQLAQFSQLEALTNMQSSLDKFVSSMSSERMLASAGLIGKRVMVGDGLSRLDEGGQVDASIDLPDGASGVKLQIHDSRGRLVQEMVAGPQAPGAMDFSWDGIGADNQPAAAGFYKLSAIAVVNGKTGPVPVQTLSTIRGVTHDAATGAIQLSVDGGNTVSLTDVKRIHQ